MAAHRKDLTRRHQRAVALVTWSLALVVPAGIGWALWSTSGTGPGAAKARTATALTVTISTAGADLYPGASGDLHFSVTNPNPYAITLTGASTSSISAVIGGSGGCTAADFTLPTGTMASTPVPAGGTVPVTVTGGIAMKAAAGDGCQGVDLTVSATLSGTQS